MDGRWVEVGDGVLARRYTELDLTVGLVLGAERALVVDTRGDARQGAELAIAVRAVTPLPLAVAITHAHFDHCFGTAAFAPAPVHALPRCRAVLAATAETQRSRWAAYYRDRGDPDTADALAATEPPLPDADAPAVLDLGSRRAELLHLGRGHTDHDLVVSVPDAGVVFAGDLVEQGARPDLGDAVVPDWPATLDALLALHPRTVVPGHGDPVDPPFVAAQRAELAEVAALHAAVAQGALSAAEAATAPPTPPSRGPPAHDRDGPAPAGLISSSARSRVRFARFRAEPLIMDVTAASGGAPRRPAARDDTGASAQPHPPDH